MDDCITFKNIGFSSSMDVFYIPKMYTLQSRMPAYQDWECELALGNSTGENSGPGLETRKASW